MSRERDESYDRSHSRSPDRHDFLVKIRGIFNSSSTDDIKRFLSPCRIVAIHLFKDNGTALSNCFADLESEVDVKNALKKSGQYLDKIRFEIFRATSYEYNFHVKHKGMVSWREAVIRMSGLPFTCTMGEVQNFFENTEIAKNGIYITRDMADKALGDGFVAFVNMDNAYKAIEMHNHKHIQHRYIELFPSTYDEAKRRIMNDALSNAKQFVGEDEDEHHKKANDNNNNNDNNNIKRNSQSRSRSPQRPRSKSPQRPRSKSPQHSRSRSSDYRSRDIKRRRSPSGSPPARSYTSSKTGNQRSYRNSHRRSRSRSPVRRSSSRSEEHLVKIRGMPYTVVEDDIRNFFPKTCQPKRIEIMQDRRMKRPNGDAHLYFSTLDEVDEALKYDRKYMGSRYVEIYFDSPRYLSLNIRRKKPESNSLHSSHSPLKTKHNRYSRSRSKRSIKKILPY